MIVICGLPGTGKTTLCKRLSNEFQLEYKSDWDLENDEHLQDFVIDKIDSNLVLDVDLRNINERDILFFKERNMAFYILIYNDVRKEELIEKLGEKAEEYLLVSSQFKNVCQKEGYNFYSINKDKDRTLEKLYDEIKESVMKVADKEELLIVLDENGNSTGRKEKRSIVHSNELFHNEIALWVINGNKVLLQRRSPNKKLYPNKLALCAGHVVGDESLLEALYKEASEEIGIDLSKYEVKPITTLKREEPKNHCFSHHYFIKADIPISEFKIQEEELSEVMYKDFAWVKENMKNGNEEISYKWSSEYARLFEELEKIIKND